MLRNQTNNEIAANEETVAFIFSPTPQSTDIVETFKSEKYEKFGKYFFLKEKCLWLHRLSLYLRNNAMSLSACLVIIILLFSFKNSVTSRWQLDIERKENSNIQHDYSIIRGIHDLEVENDFIKNRCYPGKSKVCDCANTMIGADRIGHRHWLKASHFNSESAASKHEVDVVFFGDSITEGWMGTNVGFEVGRQKENPKVFKSLFTYEGGGKYEGLALGISGDTSANLLWRLQHGELPPGLNPSVFWVLIGTNDFGQTWCSNEVTLIGIIRVIEEIKLKKTDAVIVVNSILPRSFDKKNGFLHNKLSRNFPPLWADIQIVNKQLEKYCHNRDKLFFFNATDIFLQNRKKPSIDKNLMADFLHPTALGYKLWGDKIVQTLNEIFAQNS